MNWRKPLLSILLHAGRPHIPPIVKHLRQVQWWRTEHLLASSEQHLARLLLHAWLHTEYYRAILEEAGTVTQGHVDLSRFSALPLLEKSVLQSDSERLSATAGMKGRRIYANASGGSSGQPVRFYQDSRYDDYNNATKLFMMEMLGKELGDRELKIWGSERDLFEGTIGWKAKLQFLIYNRSFRNCFVLNDNSIAGIIAHHNLYRPVLIWGYVDALFHIACYARKNNIKLFRPNAIISAAGTLHPNMRSEIEAAFGASIYNSYGSREMGAIACECPMHGLHIFTESHRVEVVDGTGRPIDEGEGEIVITSLHNYAMPLIRYRIGDRAIITREQCPCGRGFPLLKHVTGRVMETLVNARGDLIPPEYFIHLVGVVYNSGGIERFQVIQEELKLLRIKIVTRPGQDWTTLLQELQPLTEKVQLVLGKDCNVLYEHVEQILPTSSGKYLYVVNQLAKTHTASS